MARLRDNDDDLMFQSDAYPPSPRSSHEEALPTPGVYTRSSGGKSSSYRELIDKDAERHYYEPAYAEPPVLAAHSPGIKPRSKPVAKRGPRVGARAGEDAMARPSYSHPDHHLPHELDVLWSGTRSLFKEDRPPIVVFSLGLVLGIGLTTAVFLLLMNRPASLTATTLTNPDTPSVASAGMPLNQPAEQTATQDPLTASPVSGGATDAGTRQIPTAGTRHLSLSKEGAIRSSSDAQLTTPPNNALAPATPAAATSPAPAGKGIAAEAENVPSLFGIKLAWLPFKLPGTTNGAISNNGAASATAASAPAQESQPYEVKAGDTLGSIGYRFWKDSSPTAIKRIQEANHLSSPDKLALGQKLIIPPAP